MPDHPERAAPVPEAEPTALTPSAMKDVEPEVLPGSEPSSGATPVGKELLKVLEVFSGSGVTWAFPPTTPEKYCPSRDGAVESMTARGRITRDGLVMVDGIGLFVNNGSA